MTGGREKKGNKLENEKENSNVARKGEGRLAGKSK